MCLAQWRRDTNHSDHNGSSITTWPLLVVSNFLGHLERKGRDGARRSSVGRTPGTYRTAREGRSPRFRRAAAAPRTAWYLRRSSASSSSIHAGHRLPVTTGGKPQPGSPIMRQARPAALTERPARLRLRLRPHPETVAAWPLIFPSGMNPVVHEYAGLRQAAWYFAKVAIAHRGSLVRA
jgi:hypothetical protein